VSLQSGAIVTLKDVAVLVKCCDCFFNILVMILSLVLHRFQCRHCLLFHAHQCRLEWAGNLGWTKLSKCWHCGCICAEPPITAIVPPVGRPAPYPLSLSLSLVYSYSDSPTDIAQCTVPSIAKSGLQLTPNSVSQELHIMCEDS